MKIITGLTEFHMDGPSSVAIGKFDGIHVGHEALLTQVLEAKNEGLSAVIFTFTPSPYEFFTGEKSPELMTVSEKRSAFESAGVDVLWEFPMNRYTACMEPLAFIRHILVECLHAKLIVAGDDLSFGDKGRGDASLLKRYAKEFGYEVSIIEKVCLLGKAVSSTYVRNEIRAGHMENAAILLGKPYSFAGTVCHGRQLGRSIGMPTVNLIPEAGKLFPPFGVYYSRVCVGQKEYPGITNIGRKPTVNDTPAVFVETYLYDFSGDLYDREIEVFLLSYKRAEQRFESVEALKDQLARDRKDGEIYFSNQRKSL